MERPMQGSETPTISSTLNRLQSYREQQAELKRDNNELNFEREKQYKRALGMLENYEKVSYGPSSKMSSNPHRETPLLNIPTKGGGTIPVKLVEVTAEGRDYATENPNGIYTPYMVQIEYWESGVGDDGYARTTLYDLQTHRVGSFDYTPKTSDKDNKDQWRVLAEATMFLDAIETAIAQSTK